MWKIEYEDERARMLTESQHFSDDDNAIIAAWINQIAMHGPESVRGDFKWADHELHEGWEGYRSSSFSKAGRIIYRVIEKRVLIHIARITSDHDYKREDEP